MKRLISILFLTVIVLNTNVDAIRSRLFKKSYAASADSLLNVKELTYKNMKLDHFDYASTDTFDVRIMWNNTFYKENGPILFYTGNEGNLESFVSATGMMFSLAPILQASIIFVEHRFYGKSIPNKKNFDCLTTNQALADFAEVLQEFKRKDNQFNYTFPANTRVITFGGSYGGMLSAWFRMKYPHIVDGAWAGSAPLIYFQGSGVDEGVFDSIATRTYKDAGCNIDVIRKSWNATIELSKTPKGLVWLNNNPIFNLTYPINDTNGAMNLNAFLREAIEYMAMVDYPYPTSFLQPLPAWPVNEACKYMNVSSTDNLSNEDLVSMVARAANIFYNYNNNTNYTYCIDPVKCGDPGTGGLGDSADTWTYQECTEIVIPMCAKGGASDMFWNECQGSAINFLKQTCKDARFSWNSAMFDVNAIATNYGIQLSSSASNIILTQGHLDPWSGGGYPASASDYSRGIYAFEIPGSAHHLDLRTPNTCDPNTVVDARRQIFKIIKCWAYPDQCKDMPQLQSLPELVIPKTVKCHDAEFTSSSSSMAHASLLISIAYVIRNFILS